MEYLCNAFSLQMLQGAEAADISVLRMDGAPCLGEGVRCCIGHADTAAIVGRLVGRPGLKANRESVTLQPGDVVFVAQLTGGRLPEGATTLPEGFEIAWYEVTYRATPPAAPAPKPQDPARVTFFGVPSLGQSVTLIQEPGKAPVAEQRYQPLVGRRAELPPAQVEEISVEEALRMILAAAPAPKPEEPRPSFEGVTIGGFTVRGGAVEDQWGNYIAPLPKVTSLAELTEWLDGLDVPE